MKFDPRVTWAKFDPSREHVFVLREITQLSRFDNEDRKKNT